MKTFKQFLLTEIDFPNREALLAYKAKHKMRPDTVVNVGGKETTVQKALDKDTDTSGDKKPKVKTVVHDTHTNKVGDQYWKKPDAEMISREHDEIAHQIDVGNEHPDWAPDHVQSQLKKLQDSGDWEKAMKNAKTINISPDDKDLTDIGNTEAGGSEGLDALDLDLEKVTRVKKQFKDNAAGTGKAMEKPIILYDKATGHKHLLAGNTRLTHGIVDRKSTVPVTAIEYDSSK